MADDLKEIMNTNHECHLCLRLIDAAVDNELDNEETTAFEVHLSGCVSCCAELEAARSLREIMALGDTSVVLSEPLEESTEMVMSRIAVETRPIRISRSERVVSCSLGVVRF